MSSCERRIVGAHTSLYSTTVTYWPAKQSNSVKMQKKAITRLAVDMDIHGYIHGYIHVWISDLGHAVDISMDI